MHWNNIHSRRARRDAPLGFLPGLGARDERFKGLGGFVALCPQLFRLASPLKFLRPQLVLRENGAVVKNVSAAGCRAGVALQASIGVEL